MPYFFWHIVKLIINYTFQEDLIILTSLYEDLVFEEQYFVLCTAMRFFSNNLISQTWPENYIELCLRFLLLFDFGDAKYYLQSDGTKVKIPDVVQVSISNIIMHVVDHSIIDSIIDQMLKLKL
jgi:hypothetical protein